MKTCKAVIIEDEERSTIVLQNLLETYCPDVEVVGNATSVQDGIKTVNALQPDILFLDVQIVGGTGFDILEKLNNTRSPSFLQPHMTTMPSRLLNLVQ